MAKVGFEEILQGASISQLAKLFDLDRRTVTDRLRDVAPSGFRSTHKIYRISDVAEHLVHGYQTRGGATEAEKLKQAPREKDFWDAQLKKQKYEENEGDLWRTAKVYEVFIGVFRLIRETMAMYVDKLEHESDLPEKKIKEVKELTDGLLRETRDKLMAFDTGESEDDDEEDDSQEPDFDELERELGL